MQQGCARRSPRAVPLLLSKHLPLLLQPLCFLGTTLKEHPGVLLNISPCALDCQMAQCFLSYSLFPLPQKTN